MQWSPRNIIITTAGTITAISTIVGAFIAIDTRYAKAEQMIVSLNSAKNEIIQEMRREVVKNRAVMITQMQREADDIEWKILQIEEAGETAPRFMHDKLKLILRDIEELENGGQ